MSKILIFYYSGTMKMVKLNFFKFGTSPTWDAHLRLTLPPKPAARNNYFSYPNGFTLNQNKISTHFLNSPQIHI